MGGGAEEELERKPLCFIKFRIVFWDVLPCKIIVDRRFRGTELHTRRRVK
jgi:hypothetical protein